ncbi:MAG: methyltransferase [Verrucomicrobia bacterium RIFCSPHIGHO2_12_FULL_41_10]|nr:MAG: methyltransferase [Verrucomicrobia bacterium RIFCSPHIGHO2_12_FULL_41_10]
MYNSEGEAKACLKGDIRLVEDSQTGLVYNAAFCPEFMTYDNHYQNEQAYSFLFQQHLESVSLIIDRLLGRNRLIEVGCGKGYFLEMLSAKGFEVVGFDPTYEGTNPLITPHYFEHGAVSHNTGLILRHVLEHIQDPFGFLLQLKEANGGSGKVYIEVPCFDWICDRRAWFDISYEHVNYFRLSDFRRMFGDVIESGRLFGDQYLYVVTELATLQSPKIDLNDSIVFPNDFIKNIANYVKQSECGGVVWGGAAKGVIFALLSERAGRPIMLAELEIYAPFTTKGSYCVVYDGIIEDIPKKMFPDNCWGPGDNPKTAVWEYLKTHPEFEIDKSIQNKLLITVAPDGFLKRVF